ncbi:MAG TPA: hypothetical protein VGQ36_08470 [Thermoanaerobaculia bacterium]|nr:hypothetical protein [Thermoanaerobaculia bacterium]
MLPQEQIADEFRRRRSRQWFAAVPGIAAFFFVVFGFEPDSSFLGIDTDSLFILAAGVIVGYLMFSIWNWRCPACDGYLGKSMNPTFCIKCGARLKP